MTTPGTDAFDPRKYIEQTLVLLKPDAVRRGIASEILARFEKVGLKIVAIKLVHVTRSFAERHYTYEDIAVRHGEEIREQLLRYITEGPVIAAVLEGIQSVRNVRKICGPTEPLSALPGTIRGDYCHQGYDICNESKQAIRNVIHASASPAEAQHEVSLWFNTSEIVSYRRTDDSEHILA